MEQSNVNNLNGIPNFGHGWPEEVEAELSVQETPHEEEKDVESAVSETEENDDK